MTHKNSPVVRELFDDVTSAEREQLHADPEEWLDDLIDLIQSLEAQLGRVGRQLDEYGDQVDAELAALDPDVPANGPKRARIKADYHDERRRVEEWRRSVLSILKRAQRRKTRVTRYVGQQKRLARQESRVVALSELVAEVDRHRDAIEEDGIEPSDADRDLWAVADRVREEQYERIA